MTFGSEGEEEGKPCRLQPAQSQRERRPGPLNSFQLSSFQLTSRIGERIGLLSRLTGSWYLPLRSQPCLR